MNKKLMIVFVLVLLFCTEAFAETETYNDMAHTLNFERLEKTAPDGAEKTELSRDISFKEEMKKVFDSFLKTLKQVLFPGISCITSIVAVSLLLSATEAFCNLGENPVLKNVTSLIAAISITSIASKNLVSVIGMGREFITGIDTFSKALLPTVAAAEAASGGAGAATVKASAAILFSDILITAISRVLLPLVYVGLAAATANAAAPGTPLKKISDLSSWIIGGFLKISLGIFVSYITVAGIVSGGVDKAALKAAQLAMGGGVPIVGPIISEAAGTVMAGAMLIKNVVGVFGIVSILSAFVLPCAHLSVNYFLFKMAAIFVCPMIDGTISELTDRIATAFGLVLAMSASVATVILVSVIAAMQSVGVI